MFGVPAQRVIGKVAVVGREREAIWCRGTAVLTRISGWWLAKYLGEVFGTLLGNSTED